MSNVQRPMTREIPLPKDKVGLVIGRKGSQVQEIRSQTGVNIIIKDNHAHLRGTAEQCQHAETMIEEILTSTYNKKGRFKKLNVTIPEKFMGSVIGKGRENLNDIETRTGVALKVIDNHLHFKGSTEQEKKVIREIRNMVRIREKGCNARFVHVDTAHLKEDHAFKLSVAQPSPNIMVGLKCFKLDLEDDPLEEETPSGFADTEGLKEEMLGILKQIHKEKEEEMIIVDIWCHFGHAYLCNVDEDDENDPFTLEELKDKIESTAGDRWKTFLSEVETIEVKQIEKYLRDCACTASDDIRYDLAFFTPSGLEVRVKVWLIEKEAGAEGAPVSPLAFRHSAPLPVRNALTQVLPVEHSGDASNSPIFHICDTFHERMKLDILMPCAGFDCRLKIRTFPKSPKTTTPQAEEERKILETYFMEMSIEDGQLKFPPISKLPDGFDLFYQRRSLRKTYQYENDGDMFTLTVCKDQSKEVNPDQTDAYSFNESEAKPDVHLHCEEWDQVLNEGNWEPEQIIAKLPKFLQFLRDVQGILPHSNSK